MPIDCAFRYCYDLSKISFKNCINLTKFDSGYGFYYCMRLTQLDFSDCVKLNSIGYDTFIGCYTLVQLKFNSQSPVYNNITSKIDEDTLSNPDLEIGNENTTFTNKLETVGNYVYYTTSSKKYLMCFSAQGLLTATEVKGVASDITDVYDYAFFDVDYHTSYNNDKITNVDFSGLTKLNKIGQSAFESCNYFQTVNFTNCINLKIVDENAFRYSGIKNIYFNGCSNLKQIGRWVFDCCYELVTVDFTGCSNLELLGSMSFGNTIVKNIDLSMCTNLITIENSVFMNCEELEIIYLSSSVKDTITLGSDWKPSSTTVEYK